MSENKKTNEEQPAAVDDTSLGQATGEAAVAETKQASAQSPGESTADATSAALVEPASTAEATSAARVEPASTADATSAALSEPAPEALDPMKPPLPTHLQPVPKEKLVKAKRTKRILIAVIIVLILVLACGGAAGVYYYLNYGQDLDHAPQASTQIETGEDSISDRGTTATIEMPNLASFFGKTPDETLAVLGADYQITKTEAASTDATAAAEGEVSEGATDTSTNQQVVTISYKPTNDSSSVGTSMVQNIYLTLDANGQTAEVYFVSSMNLLDFPISSFAALVGTQTSFVKTLTSAGVSVSSDFAYTAPTTEEYTQYVDPEANPLKIKKETVTMKGALASEQAPTQFEITYTYDYGASGVEDTPDKQPSQKMLYIKLS